MIPITNLQFRRDLGESFYLEIPLDGSEEEIKTRISHAMSVEQSVRHFLDGERNIEELIEEVEPTLLDLGIEMDNYLEAVEENIEFTLYNQLFL